MKLKKGHLGLIVVFILFLVPLTGALAQDEGFTETFDDSSLNGWERSEQSVVKDGVLVVSPGNFAVKFGSYGGGTYEYKAKFAGPGAMFFRFFMHEEGCYAVIFFEDRVVLEKAYQDTPTELAVYEGTISAVDWTNVKVTINQGEIEVYINDGSILKATDTEPLTGGSVGFWVEGESAAEYDDLSVSPASAGAPVEGGEVPVPAEPVPTAAPETPSSFGVQDLISGLSTSQANPLELTTFIINLGLSVLFSFVLSRVYVHWGTSLSNRRRFAANFILIAVTTTFIILVVRSSVALSLGLVGALSIVRFRAAIKEPEELAYLFFAISIGIGLGDNQRLITVLALLVAIATAGIMRLFRGRQADFNLHVTVASHNPEKIELESIMDVLSAHCSQVKLMRFDDSASSLESSFLVEFKNIGKLNQAKNALRNLSPSLEITFLDNKGIW